MFTDISDTDINPPLAVNLSDIVKLPIMAVGIVTVPVNVGDTIAAFKFNELSTYDFAAFEFNELST